MLPRRDLLALIAATAACRRSLACTPPAAGIEPMRYGGDWLVPPYDKLPRTYFESAARHPFQPQASDCSVVNAWWLAEAATLAYHSGDRIGEMLPRGCGSRP